MAPPLTPTQSRALGALLGLHAGDSLGATLEFKSHAAIKSLYPNGLREIVGGGPFSWPPGHATDDTDMTRAVALAYRKFRKASSSSSPTSSHHPSTSGSGATPASPSKSHGSHKHHSKSSSSGGGRHTPSTPSLAAPPAGGGGGGAGSSPTKPKPQQDILHLTGQTFLTWLHGPWPSRAPSTRPKDIGNATLTGLMNFSKSLNPYTSGAGPGRAGNGSLMRCIPTALFQPDRDKMIRETLGISGITHDDARCTISCAAYNTIVAKLVSSGGTGGVTAESAVKEGEKVALRLEKDLGFPEGGKVVAAIRRARELSVKKMAEVGPPQDFTDRCGGFVLESLSLGIAALLDGRSFEDVLVDVVRVGADSDTNGAIAGGLLGARDGVEGVPKRWREKLQFGAEFESFVRDMVE